MSAFVVECRTELPPGEVWRRLTAWERHSGSVPLTRVTVRTSLPTCVGTVVVARTGVGPAGFTDPMRVTVWEPPDEGGEGRCRLEKTGRVVLGWAEIEVRPDGAGTYVRWHEDLRVRGLPRAFDGLTRAASRTLFRRALTTLLAED
ncbi:SRPBCC family protein [Streptomyces sp. NRRL F-5123]|uniref:SRPBCC family protein n=1 Tax=Streptomyces sp. NRRL F-5123 TaxID=1463856 RepID=UPI0004E17DCA|nr:SRPBCC family protein [Streptomyces sp. NRRL F-5123]